MLCGRNKPLLELKPVLLLIIIFVLISCGNKGPLVILDENIPQDTRTDDSTEAPQL